MGAPISRNMCCSIREKDGFGKPFAPSPHFVCSEVEMALDKLSFVAFSPLWATGIRRLAVASTRTVHIYRMSDSGKFEVPKLESTLEMEEGFAVTALIFRDEDTSRAFVIACRPEAPSRGIKHYIRIWPCDPLSGDPQMPGTTSQSLAPRALQRDGVIASLEDHVAPVSHLAVNSTCLVSCDASGECRLWQKNRAMACRATARLHKGPVVDVAVDRHFVYSLGEESNLRIWSMELKEVAVIQIDSIEASCLMGSFDAPLPLLSVPSQANPNEKDTASSIQFSRLSALKRPVSRWSGGQAASGRGTTSTPRGLLFVAATMAKGQSAAGENAGVLMEWSIGSTSCCQSAVIAHDVPIASIAYGPCDNGPLITCDVTGLCRIWDCSPRLWCSQQIEASPGAQNSQSLAKVSVASDPTNSSLYSVAGEKRLLVWCQRSADIAPIGSP